MIVLKHKMTKTDFFLLILAIFLLIAAPLFFFRILNEEGEIKQVEYTLLFENTTLTAEDASKLISSGSEVYSSNGTAKLGIVGNITLRPHRIPVLQNGEILFVDAPERWDIRISVNANGRFSENDGFRISEIRICGGERGDFHVGGYRGAATVLWIKEVEE